jgi:truncated hemoglobin YjbI
MRNVIKVKPPLTITDEEMDRVLETFKACVEQVSKIPAEMKQEIMQRMLEAAGV